MLEGRKLHLHAHKPIAHDMRFPDAKPRGGEISMAQITAHLHNLGAEVHVTVAGVHKLVAMCDRDVDVLFTWGRAARETRDVAMLRKIPYVLGVRWWRNVCDVSNGIGDLRTRDIEPGHKAVHAPIFQDAHRVICNNKYTAEVVSMHYGVECDVSYVPIMGQVRGTGNSKGAVAVVTDGKALGTEQVVLNLSAALPGVQFLVVNAADPGVYAGRANITATGYVDDMTQIWPQVSILLYPNYINDVCGTSRVAGEAALWGIPSLANDRAGICEKGMRPLPRDASVDDWAREIRRILESEPSYALASREAVKAALEYDTNAQLNVWAEAMT